MKKKILVLSLIVVCLLSALLLASCGGGGGGNDNRPSYTVTFDPAGGQFDGELSIQVKEGDKIPKPADPVFEGKTFTGWYAGKKSSSRWDFDTQTVTEDVNLKAWYAGGSSCSHEATTKNEEKSYAATCTKMGLEVVVCNKCRLEIKTPLPATGHNEQFESVPVTCAQNGYDRKYCANEGCTYEIITNEKPATGLHDWGNKFVTLVEPTKYVGGKEAKTCTVCGQYQVFTIPSFAEMEGDFDNKEIGDYRYTGGDYVDAPFVDIAKYAGTESSSYYTVCYAKNAADGATGTFWCADTLANGINPIGDTLTLTFAKDFTIGLISILVPHYSAWELGEDCYVSYDLEALIDGEWVVLKELNDKDATPSGISATITCEFESPITTSAIRLVVTNASRHAPAMVYEVEVMADVNDIERVSKDLLSVSTLASSGKYNSWATGAEALIDGSLSKGWQTNIRNLGDTISECFASLTFPDAQLVTAVQFAVGANANKAFSVYYLDENDEWELACSYTLSRGNTIKVTGDSDGDGSPDGVEIELDDGSKLYQFTCEIDKFTKGVKLSVEKDDPWSSFVYEFTPYSVVQQAVVDKLDVYEGCPHNAYKIVETVEPTCLASGYSWVECYGCGLRLKTDATDALIHTWGDFVITTEATATVAGVKTATCTTCGGTKTTAYEAGYKDATITTYYHDAPAAWSISLDDGNYTTTYDWIIPKLQERGWKATIAIAICFSDSLADKWQNEYFKSGAFDLASHSYNHAGIYSGKISEPSMIDDVHTAHYWFMNKFPGQRILGFATPNGTTSDGTSSFVLGLMSTCRNGGGPNEFWVTPSELSSRRDWGYINSYISKADQTEGPYIFVDAEGKVAGHYKKITQEPVIDEETGEQAVDENGNLLWNTLDEPIYEFTDKGSYSATGSWIDGDSGTHLLLKTPNDYYHLVAKADIEANTNYVYDKTVNSLVNMGRVEGTYIYTKTTDANGKLTDSVYSWVELGSYDKNSDGTFTFRNDNNGAYKLNHPALGSYEKGINQILTAGGWTVECLHCIEPDHTKTNQIWSSYASTNSKHQYLEQTGIWVGSWTEVTQYLREAANATLTTVSRTDAQIVLTLTDTLDDYMFNFPLTLKVDINDDWALTGIKATQNGKEVYSFVKDGFAFVDAVPDAGEIVITPVTLCDDGTTVHKFGDWVETKAPTCWENGEKTKTCEICDHAVTEVIEAVHSYEVTSVEGNVVYATCTKCNLSISTNLVNVTSQSVNNSTVNLISGELNKRSKLEYLCDSNYSTSIASSNGSLVLELDMTGNESPFVDYITLSGAGTDLFTIEALYEGESEYVELGSGTLKEGGTYEAHKRVTKIRITQLSFDDKTSCVREIVFNNIPL